MDLEERSGARPLHRWITAMESASGEDARILAPHLYDVLDQLLIRYIDERALWKGNRSLRSASLSAKARAVISTDEPLARQVMRLSKTTRAVRHGAGSDEEMRRFVKTAETLVEILGARDTIIGSFAPVGLRVVNAVSVDTKQGYRSVQLVHAHVADIRADVLAVTSHNTVGDRPSGFIISYLKHRCGFTSRLDQPFLHFAADEWTCLQPAEEAETAFRCLLTLRLGQPHEDGLLEPFIDRALAGLYASLAAMESLGLPTESIAMPVLRAHHAVGTADYEMLVGLLVRHAVCWLKRASETTTVNLCVYFGDELDMWAEAMDRTLGRTLVAAGQDAAVESLMREVVHLAARFRDGALGDAIRPLLATLARPERVSVEQVGVEGRKLVETMLADLLPRRGKTVGLELLKNIETAREGGIAAPWVVAYMHTLRIFGNEGVHARLADRVYTPNRLGLADLVTALAAIRALLLYWAEVSSVTGPPPPA